MQLHHEIAGSGDTIVLIHAGIADSRMWTPQWRRYAEDYQVVRYDMRGFGQSPLPPEPYQHAQDLLDLLDRLEIERAVLIGNSLGGRVALEATLARPQLVTVSDEGAGVPLDQRERIFEPFHRLQPRPRGAGLGLNLVQEIVRWHHGNIAVADAPRGGAAFTITLPLALPK